MTANKLQQAEQAIPAHKDRVKGLKETRAEIQQKMADKFDDPVALATLSARYNEVDAQIKASDLVLEQLEDNLRAFRVDTEQGELKANAKQAYDFQVKRETAKTEYVDLQRKLDAKRQEYQHYDAEANAKLSAMEVVAHRLIKLGVSDDELRGIVAEFGHGLTFPYLHSDADV